MVTSISISCKGDRIFADALKALAYQQGLTVGELVRNAIDTKFGDQLQPHLDFFVAKNDDKNNQLDAKNTESIHVG